MNKLLYSTIIARLPLAGRFLSELKFTLAALEIGSRAVPFADHRELIRDLSARAAALHRAE